jgi:cytochrome c oxidase subunit 3/cytochrome o ubiquinol oxidase subunit 3
MDGRLNHQLHQMMTSIHRQQQRMWFTLAEHAVMTTDSHTDIDGAAHTSTGLSNNKLGMWLFLGSECLLFGGLISTYMLYRGRVGEGPRPSQVFDIPFTSVSSFVLLMSSLTMVLAVSAAHKGDDRNTYLWTTVTALLGATFVGGQVYEFTAFYNEGMGFTTSLFSSSFYVLTGFHGVHVTVGIIMLMSIVGIMKRSKVPGSKSETVEMIGLYWHFVDVVWIIIFTLIYLIPA